MKNRCNVLPATIAFRYETKINWIYFILNIHTVAPQLLFQYTRNKYNFCLQTFLSFPPNNFPDIELSFL